MRSLPSTFPTDLDPEELGGCDTPDSFCRAMKICRTTLYADIAAGDIKIVKRGRKTLIPISERDAYLRRWAERSKA